MATVAALRSQVAAIRAKVEMERAGREWSIVLEEGEEVSDEMRAQLGPHDTVFVREYPRGYLGVDGKSSGEQVMCSWLVGAQGRPIPRFIRQYGVDVSKV